MEHVFLLVLLDSLHAVGQLVVGVVALDVVEDLVRALTEVLVTLVLFLEVEKPLLVVLASVELLGNDLA